MNAQRSTLTFGQRIAVRAASVLVMAIVVAVVVGRVDASIKWNWSFPGFAGTFETTGSLPALAGSYTITDMTVTTAMAPFPTGSLNVEYEDGLLALGSFSPPGYQPGPTTFQWDGSQPGPGNWNTGSSNSYVGLFAVAPSGYLLGDFLAFGTADNHNVGSGSAAAISYPTYASGHVVSGGALSLEPIPEPAAATLAALAGAMLLWHRRRGGRRRQIRSS